MALILNIETATTVCSAALSRNGIVISKREENKGFTHSENLTSFIEDLMQEAGLPFSQLDAVAVSSGPGSYTGLRIGISTAKGYCYALDKPLIAVPTLQALASQVHFTGLRCPMLDARRMEVYCALYDENLEVVEPVSAKIIDESSFADVLSRSKISFFGDGAAKCKVLLSKNPNAVFIDGVLSTSESMTKLAEEKFRNEEFENVALFEPFYLKEFVPGIKK